MSFILEQTVKNTHLIKNFPYIKQTDNNCGGASAAMLFSFYGYKEVTQEYVKSKSDPISNGIDHYKLRDFMLKEAASKKLECTANESTTIAHIRSYISGNIPVLILFNDKLNSNHFAVIIGFDHHKKIFTFADPNPDYGDHYKRLYDEIFPENINLFTIILMRTQNLI